jgi:hypothetical protein
MCRARARAAPQVGRAAPSGTRPSRWPDDRTTALALALAGRNSLPCRFVRCARSSCALDPAPTAVVARPVPNDPTRAPPGPHAGVGAGRSPAGLACCCTPPRRGRAAARARSAFRFRWAGRRRAWWLGRCSRRRRQTLTERLHHCCAAAAAKHASDCVSAEWHPMQA